MAAAHGDVAVVAADFDLRSLVDGVPLAVDATAQVLFVGRYHFTMEWAYESVNGQRVGSPIARSADAVSSHRLTR